MSKEIFSAVMGNLRTVGTKSYACVPTNLLTVDPEYQRIEGRNEKKIKKLVTLWDPLQMDALKVVPHKETGDFSVVDGLGRLTAAGILGLNSLECEIINGPDDSKERRKFEARIFLGQTPARDPINAAQMHNARMLLGDPTALTIDKLLKEYNIKFAKTKGSRIEGYLGSYATTYKITEKIQEEGLEYILNTLCEAGYNLIHDGLSSSLFRALAKIYLAYNIDISDYIRNMSPGILKAKARAKYSEQPSSHIALTLFLQDYIVQKYPVRKRINKKGKILTQ